MSTNIRSSRYLNGMLSIRRLSARNFANKYRNVLPEANPLDYILWERGDEEEVLRLEQFPWTGTWSGNSYVGLLDEFLGHTTGEAEIIFDWEDGQLTGKRVKNGVVTDHTVGLKLEG